MVELSETVTSPSSVAVGKSSRLAPFLRTVPPV